ncbi:MAG TPA: PEP-CTERM sorting domain-containing protein, partial [Verrucomicrobiae bacterium]|nr:PEP-CTERM sorting domain-containing protein [Verrucomicrobiae bacterium]
SGNDYILGIPQLRTPPDGASYTFGGHSLTINTGGRFFYKGTGSAGTVTIADLILNGGSIEHQNGSGDVFNLAGTLNVTADSTIWAKQGPINIIGTLTGAGTITNPSSDGAGRTLTIAGANLYAGSIINDGRFEVAENSAFNFLIGANGINNSISGTGGETVYNGSFIFNLVGAGTTPGDSWLVAGAANQTYGSTFGLVAFTDNGGGVWTTTQKGALYEFNANDGMLTVVPEPGVLVLSLLGGLGMLVGLRRSRKA